MGLSLVASVLSSPIDSMRTVDARDATAAAPGAVAGAKHVAARGARDSMSVERLPTRSTGNPAKRQLSAQSLVTGLRSRSAGFISVTFGGSQKLDDRSEGELLILR